MIELGVVQAVEQMDCAGAGGGQADTYFTCEFGMGTCHECGHFFMPDLDKVEFVRCTVERTHNAVDAIAWKTENAFDTPLR